jgi:hypothetical protein
LSTLGHVSWDSLWSALCGGLFALACVYVGHRLERSRTERQRQSNARYRLLVLLRQLQAAIANAVQRSNRDCAEQGDAERRYKDSLLKLVLNESTRSLQDAVVDLLRQNDDLPELTHVRRALWCPGQGVEQWLASITEAVRAIEQRVCPKLRACEAELYAELPEPVRQIIEHPEDLRRFQECSVENPT